VYCTHASEDAHINAKGVTTRYHGQRRADVKYYKVDTPASRYRAPPPNGEGRLLFSLRLRHGSFPDPRHSCQSCDDKTPQSCDARLVVFRRVPRASSSSHTARARSDSEPRRRDLPGLRCPRPCHVVAQNPLPLCPFAGARTAPRPESSLHRGRAPPAWKRALREGRSQIWDDRPSRRDDRWRRRWLLPTLRLSERRRHY
jgi:hypothetical protein